MNVLFLVGSHRRDSWTVQVAKELHRLAPGDVSAKMYPTLEALPFYSQDHDVADVEVLPAAVADLRQAIHQAEALVVLTPEYNGSLPGVLKNAIDWASRPRGDSSLDDKPVAIVSVSPSPGGGQRAGQDLVKVLGVAGADVVGAPVSIASVYQVMEDGRLNDPKLETSLTAKLAELVSAVEGDVEGEAA